MYNYFNQYFFAKLCGMFPEWVCDFTGICTFYQTYNYHQSRYERIAAVWDERDASIKSQKDKGANVIHVQAIDSQFLGGGILEWYPEPNWVNMCAAEFYQVKEIRATIDW